MVEELGFDVDAGSQDGMYALPPYYIHVLVSSILQYVLVTPSFNLCIFQ
jgi:hypothetical protein